MAHSKQDMIRVNVNVYIKADALQAIVSNAKKLVGKGAKGFYHVDTADQVSEMVTRFLEEKNFDSYVKNIANYQYADQ